MKHCWSQESTGPLLAINDRICPTLNSGKPCQVLAAAMEQQRVQSTESSSAYVPLERAAKSDLERRAPNLDLESQSQASGEKVTLACVSYFEYF